MMTHRIPGTVSLLKNASLSFMSKSGIMIDQLKQCLLIVSISQMMEMLADWMITGIISTQKSFTMGICRKYAR